MLERRTMSRPLALALTASMIAPTFLVGCGSNNQAASVPPPRDATPGEMTRMNPPAGQPKQGMSTGKKLAILAGAAALYYIYKKKQRENAAPQNVQYYLSKNGRAYYRDPRTKQAIWVTPPPEQAPTIQIPESEAMTYRDLQGYNNQSSGRDLSHYFPRQ